LVFISLKDKAFGTSPQVSLQKNTNFFPEKLTIAEKKK